MLFPLGIKVLTLFFIDEVAKYRDYGRSDTLGAHARVFAAEYRSQVDELLAALASDSRAAGYLSYLAGIPVESTHRGYFSIDKKTGRSIDGDVKRSGESADAAAYDLIMRDKGRLLSLAEKVRFIFSHSALREGWDNPNVFVIGMLKRSDSTVSRRQEIGRGLRLSVDQHGERTDDPVTVHSVNELTVVTDESYTAFVDGLQREVSESPGTASAYPRLADGRRRKRSPRHEENVGPREAVQQIAVDSGVLIARCVRALNDRLKIAGPRYVVQQGELRADDLTGRAAATRSYAHAATVSASSQVAYDLIGEVAAKTRLTRRTVASILRQVSAATFAQYQRSPAQFITESARLISEQRDSLSAASS